MGIRQPTTPDEVDLFDPAVQEDWYPAYDVLREQGPAALKAQLSDTTPFVEQLFHRERDLEPLDTPERRAGLKVRLRKLAATIADPDLAQAYREDLLGRYEQLWPTASPVFTVGAAARERRRRIGA